MAFSILDFAAQSKWPLIAASILTYITATCIYRRFFHPLARVPGPSLAAMTMLYQSAYNRLFYLQLERLHQIYGPIVRITPNEVHLSDIENLDKIYYMGTRYSKSPNYYNALCIPESAFGAHSNEVHRIRRGAMNPMFSRRMVLELESVVHEKVQRLCDRMHEAVGKNLPLDLHHGFRAVSVDVISDFAFDKCYNLLLKDDLGAHLFEMIRGIGPAMWVFQQIPSLQTLALKIPPSFAPYLSEPLGHVTGLQQECISQVEEVKRRMASGKYTDRPTIFSTLLSADDKPQGWSVPSTMELKDSAYSILAAAADTTGNAMAVAAFNIMKDQQIYTRLVEELETAFPDPIEKMLFVELEKLPYLTAIIKEALRLSYGVIGRLPRVVPEGGATFNGYFMPAGTIVSMSSWVMHRNTSVFPEPAKFDPERWLDPDDYRRLDRHMLAFGRGNRQCVGMPLAYCELYVTLGMFFRRFHDLKVYETTDWDMEYEDFFSSYCIAGRKWLKAAGNSKIDV